MAFTPRTATYFYTDDGSMSYPYAIPVDKPSGTAEGDILRIDVDVAGTGTKGLDVILTFKTP